MKRAGLSVLEIRKIANATWVGKDQYTSCAASQDLPLLHDGLPHFIWKSPPKPEISKQTNNPHTKQNKTK